jgi:hypothetical protein
MGGLKKIVSIKAVLNNGLSGQLKAAFPNIVPVLRPPVKDQRISDPHWITGLGSWMEILTLEFKNLKHIE